MVSFQGESSLFSHGCFICAGTQAVVERIWVRLALPGQSDTSW